MNLISFFKTAALGAASLLLAASCTPNDIKGEDTLKVTPSSTIQFEATGNSPYKLSVETNVEDWKVESAPKWLNINKTEKSLQLTAEDNLTEDPRAGKIVIVAGKAAPVSISVYQNEYGKEDDTPVQGEAVVTMVSTAATSVSLKSDQAEGTVKVKATIESPVDFEVKLEAFIDEAYLAEYNEINSADCDLVPAYTLISKNLTIKKGETESAEIEIRIDNTKLQGGITNYLLPVYVKGISGATVRQSKCRVNFLISKERIERAFKNVLYFEVNDTNPLNALEVLLDDGTPFFDSVILFAANINYDDVNDLVFLHNNPNVQALLDGTEKYLQPLRKAGIKVILGLLGNHTAAGLAQLSRWGAEEWAKAVATTIKTYKLDGVNLDDEYSNPPISNQWFTSISSASAAYLCYCLKTEMAKQCSWPTEVSCFDYGAIYSLPSITDNDGKVHTPGEFVDWHCGNYGSSTSPWTGQTNANCCAFSKQLNSGEGYASEAAAKNAVQNGVGYGMWFAYEPCGKSLGSGTLNDNRWRALPLFKEVAKGAYNQGVKDPTHYYKKVSEGVFDDTRYEYE